ncbi:MAG: 2-oxo acid dehydrogenase subunit E2 [Fimbriimonadaceae bacterium]
MAIQSVRIPQIGEGLQEARLVAVLKQPGDYVKRDEPIYQMETDKAVMDVESPFEGTLVAWSAPVDTILAIGAEVATMDTSETAVAEAPVVEVPATASNIVGVAIPQIGEGLQEARLVAILKQPGDKVKRDEAIYQMETDKAVMDVESPYEGTLLEWLAPVDTVLPIGAEVCRMEIVGAAIATPSHGPAASTATAPVLPHAQATAPIGGLSNEFMPPRTRAYAREKGISDAVLTTIPARGSKLMPEDIDAFQAGGAAAAVPVNPTTTRSEGAGGAYSEQPMNQKQRLLSSRLVRGNQLVVPGTMTVVMNWEPIERLRGVIKMKGGDFQPSAFTMFAYACVQALKDFPAFRSSLKGDDTIRTYDHVNLGIAVALPGDELVIAAVDKADTMSWHEFAAAMRERIDLARNGQDQAHEGISVSLTNMAHNGIRDAVAVVVPPSVATIFLGEVYNGLTQNTNELKLQRCANQGMTFDHRLINGVGAANLQNKIKELTENIGTLINVE